MKVTFYGQGSRWQDPQNEPNPPPQGQSECAFDDTSDERPSGLEKLVRPFFSLRRQDCEQDSIAQGDVA